MSFRTDKPFFPCREPVAAQNSPPAPRALWVYFIGDARPEGRIGDSGRWPGTTIWSRALLPEQRTRLAALLGLSGAQAGSMARLTAFVDRSSPRPGTDDLYFAPSADQAEIGDQVSEKSDWGDPVIITVSLVLAIVVLGFCVAWVQQKRERRE